MMSLQFRRRTWEYKVAADWNFVSRLLVSSFTAAGVGSLAIVDEYPNPLHQQQLQLLLLLLRRLLFNKTSKFLFDVFLWRSTWWSIPMIGNRTVPTLKEFPKGSATRPHLRRLLLRRQQQSCASVSTSARLHALDRRLRSRGQYEGRDPRVQDVDPKLIGTWIRRSSGCGSGDHQDEDPVFEDLGFMRYPRSQGPSHGLGLFFS